ncbi:MAG: hypothetical protein ACRD1E_02080, partial [Terriglobales bacterium]
MPRLQHTSTHSSPAPRAAAAAARAGAPAAPRSMADHAADCLALTKPRVTLLVVLTAVAACYVAAQRALEPALLAELA